MHFLLYTLFKCLLVQQAAINQLFCSDLRMNMFDSWEDIDDVLLSEQLFVANI